MARRAAPGTLIHCESCGEDYSATYKRCPFCGEKPGGWTTASLPRMDDPEQDDYVFEGEDLFDDVEDRPSRPARPRGGKRLAQDTGRSSVGAPGPINWPRLITFLCSLVIVAAALVIVFAYIYPKIHNPDSNVSADPNNSGAAVSPPPSGILPSSDPVVSNSLPGSSASPSNQPSSGPDDTVAGLTLNKDDITLSANETFTFEAAVTPADWAGTVTWSSSNPDVATVSSDGTVTNVNTGSTLLRVTITATAGNQTATASVYCRGGSSGSAPSTSPGGTPTTGNATITGADSGLRVRSGPGTSYEILASLNNGDDIVVVADAGDGWYEITFAGSGGKDVTGYIMGEYISMS